MSTQDSSNLRTADSSLAAFLYYSEIKLLAIEFQNGQGLFIFDISPGHELVDQWQSGQALVNGALYYRAYRTCLSKLFVAKREQGEG